jgi:hypothetical protein
MSWKLIHKSGEPYTAEFSPLMRDDLPLRWTRGLSWNNYLAKNSEYTAYKLTVGDTIQGAIALAIRTGYVEIDLVEKSPINRQRSEFINVAEVLFGFASKVSFDNNEEGYTILYAKTVLVSHYVDRYKMEVINKKERRMLLPPIEGYKLIKLYYI